jgi:hypothetical protein
MAAELIVYACPTGPLASALTRYFSQSRQRCGANAAHRFPPHITLTGFFHDDEVAIPIYTAALAEALERAKPSRSVRPITITRLLLREDFHGLLIESPWLEALTADFAASVVSPTRRDDIRLKSWLHLSLAYEFPPARHNALAALANEHIDIATPVEWELRFYQRLPGDEWRNHGDWVL